MFKKQLDYLSEKLNLGFWILAILVIMGIGCIIIIFHLEKLFVSIEE